MHPVAGIKLGIGRRPYLAGDAEQRAESIERVEAPVEAKLALSDNDVPRSGANRQRDQALVMR
jgi:hypothetical protein